MIGNELKVYDGLTSRQQLNLFRNLYYNDGNTTEYGIIANAINDCLTADVAPKSEVARLEQDVTRLEQENEALKDSNEHLAVMLEETKIELEAMRGAANSYKMHYETAKSEAVKEFAEKLKEEACYFGRAVAMEDIDNIAKELTGGGVCETNTTTER